jgi:hypothetical protein
MAKVKPFSAGYGGYSKNFSDYYFVDHVVHSVQNIRTHLDPNDPKPSLTWGEYQKWAPDDPNDPNNWNRNNDGSGPDLYANWEAAVAEAREDLAKLPRYKDPKTGKEDDGPDPDKRNDKKKSLVEHLDRAVTIALLEKYQIGQFPPNTGIPIYVNVHWQDKNWRRHKIRTSWDPENNGDGQYDCKSLTIHMTCPNGGWIGTALWQGYDDSTPQKDIKKFTAIYTVPALPTDEKQILFIFHGLESIPDGTNIPAILQPVLQWTTETDPVTKTTTSAWAIRSWYVPADYDPSFDQMPARGDVKPFKDPSKPAWTAATVVQPGDKLKGIIDRNDLADGTVSYKSRFEWTAAGVVTVANELTASGIAKLTYPVAVIEAYMPPVPKQKPTPVPPDGLVGSVVMTKVELTAADGTKPSPNWYTGAATTNKLKRYDVDAQVDNATQNATITFTLRPQKSKSALQNTSPAWGPTDGPDTAAVSKPVAWWDRLLGLFGFR